MPTTCKVYQLQATGFLVATGQPHRIYNRVVHATEALALSRCAIFRLAVTDRSRQNALDEHVTIHVIPMEVITDPNDIRINPPCPYGIKRTGCDGTEGPWCGYCRAESA